MSDEKEPHLKLVCDELVAMDMGQHWPAREWVVRAAAAGVSFEPEVKLHLRDTRVSIDWVMHVRVAPFIAHEVARRWVVGGPLPEQRWKIRRDAGPDSWPYVEPWER